MKRIIVIMICCFGLIIMASGQEQQAQKLLSEAIYQEEVNGDLVNAIKTYQLILTRYPDNRKISAEALLHLGLCYEKQGNQEAVKTYNRLVSNFPEQKNQVAIARERLSRLKQTADKVLATPLMPKFTKINMPTKLPADVKLSPDGKDLAMVYDYKLWIMPLKGNLGPDIPGKPVQLDIDGIKAEDSGLSWSYDGKWIAFNDLISAGKSEKSNQSIFVVPSSGGNPKKVITNYRDQSIVNYRISLSPDGKNLAFSSVENVQQHIYTAQVDGGSPKQLADMQAREPVYSPNGKMIAYVEDKGLGRGEGGLGLWIVSAQGGTPHLLADAGKASSPVWSPDGSMIAFLDYVRQKQINIVKVPKTLEAVGKVTSIDAPKGTEVVTLLAGWTPDNKIGLLSTSKEELSLYTLPATGGQATIVLNNSYVSQPRWSRDGKHIFYVTVPDGQGQTRFYKAFLASVPSNGGIGKAIPTDYQGKEGKTINHLLIQSGNRISPDGKMIVTAAVTSADTGGVAFMANSNIWKIALDGSEAKQITDKQGPYADFSPCWSPDGGKIAFYRVKLIEGDMDPFGDADIYTIDSSGGEPEQLISVPDKWIFSPAWSPDGKMIAYLSKDKEAPNTRSLNIIDVKSRELRVAGEVPAAIMMTEIAWSPDSRRIAFNDREGKVIKVMNIDDGTVQDIKTNLADDISIYQLDWSPDGKQFVFCGLKSSATEFWFLDDFMTLEKLAQKNEKEKLSESEGIRIKQIWKEPLLDDLGTVSYDGRFRSYIDWGEGDVAIQDLITGEKKKLTNKASVGGDTEYFALGTAISKNGKLIASSWCKPYNTTDLVLVDVENPTMNVIYSQKGEEVYPAAWLSDKELIATRYFPEKNIVQIVSFKIPDKTQKIIKSFEKWQNLQLACSPEGNYIAYNFANDADNGNSDINLLSAEGDKDIPLIRHSANDKVLGWVPGRKQFLFVSDRSGTWDLWAIKIDDGKPTGLPERIYADIGDVSPVGFTQNGKCYFGFVRRNYNSYIAPFNPEKGAIELGSGKSIKGSNFGLTWSPDGQHLVYMNLDNERINIARLVVRDLKTDKEQDPSNNFLTPRQFKWSPDGNSILVLGWENNKERSEGYKGGVYTVNVKTGQTNKIFLLTDYKYNIPEDDSSPLSYLEWSRDGRSFYYLFYKDRLVKHNLETGADMILYLNSDFTPYVLDLSPDGKNLLFGLENHNDHKSHLYTIPAEGGKEKAVCTAQESDIEWVKYSPDGKYIYFVELPEGTKSNLWRVPAEGGNPEKVWSSENRMEIYDIHPDGNQVAFSMQERVSELRVIENLVQELEKLEKLH